jgi:hypothetical protein
MKKQKIFDDVNNPDFIPGIFNYCDRWCERCEMTNKCANYALTKADGMNVEDYQNNNEKFWQKFGDIMNTTLEMVKEFAANEGIDLDSIDYDAIKEREEKIHKKASETEISKTSKNYIDIAGKWFDESQNIFIEKEKQLISEFEMDLPKSNPDSEAAILKDSISVIMWYKFQIHVKIMRAVSGAMEDEELADEYDFPKDSAGSAKVALIGIDRSISAWEKLLIYFPDEEDSFLKILVLLVKLRKEVEKTFPDARSFIRPGFDE